MKALKILMGTLFSRLTAATSLRRASNRPSINPIQSIFDNLKTIKQFDDAVRNPMNSLNIAECMKAMNDITLADLGLAVEDLGFIQDGQCMNICCNSQFHLAVFLLPEQASLPLHDHPQMTVLSKVVHGDLQLRSFTRVDKSAATGRGKEIKNEFLLDMAEETIKTCTDAAWLLSPSVRNIHEFTAKTTCVIFDVLMPPYEDPHRPCNFYNVKENNGDWIGSSVPEPPTLPYGVAYTGYVPIQAKRGFLRF